MGFDEYADAVRSRWPVVLAGLLLGGLCALGVSASVTPSYRATASLVFSIPVGSSSGDLSRGRAYQDRQMRAYSELGSQPLVLDAVRRDLGLARSTAQLADDVTLLVPLGTTDLEVVATAGRPGAAADLANSVAQHLVSALAAPPHSAQSGTGTLVGTASAPRVAVTPRKGLDLAVGLAVGGAGSVLLALALDDRARRRAA